MIDADNQLSDLRAEIRKKELKERASSVRPPKQGEYKASLVPEGYNCRKYVQARIQDSSTQGNAMDPNKILSVYRQIQPCPLRSQIKKIKMILADSNKEKPPQNDDKPMGESKFEYITDFI